MSYRLQQAVDELLLFIQLNPDFDLISELDNLTRDVTVLLNGQWRKTVLIIDLNSTPINIEAFLNTAAQTGSALLNHPKVDYHVMVSSRKDSELAAQGLSSVVVQNREIPVFSTRSEAFAYVRQVP